MGREKERKEKGKGKGGEWKGRVKENGKERAFFLSFPFLLPLLDFPSQHFKLRDFVSAFLIGLVSSVSTSIIQ